MWDPTREVILSVDGVIEIRGPVPVYSGRGFREVKFVGPKNEIHNTLVNFFKQLVDTHKDKYIILNKTSGYKKVDQTVSHVYKCYYDIVSREALDKKSNE